MFKVNHNYQLSLALKYFEIICYKLEPFYDIL